MKIIQNKPEGFEVISGDDALSLPLISIGAIGVISVIANALPKEMSSLINLCLQDDYLSARKFQYQLVDIIGSIFEEGNPAGVKSVLKHQKITEQHVRLPLVEVSEMLDKKIQTLCDQILKA